MEVLVLTKDEDISYAGCGLPYYVGGMIAEPGGTHCEHPAEICRTDRRVGGDRKGKSVAVNAAEKTCHGAGCEDRADKTEYTYDQPGACSQERPRRSSRFRERTFRVCLRECARPTMRSPNAGICGGEQNVKERRLSSAPDLSGWR